MLAPATIRVWYTIHKWTSLICTAFLLMLCVTGLPLIFHHELEHMLGAVEAPKMPAGTSRAPLDQIVENGLQRFPREVVQFVIWDEDEPDIVYLSLAEAYDAPSDDNRLLVMDSRTGAILDAPDTQSGFLYVMFKLHVDMFAGLPGKLFLGVMGLLFVVAIVSGVVLYAPFMRRLPFGTVRRERSRRLKWLDLHNLLGIATVMWVLVVGATGVINTWAELVLGVWKADQLAEMVAPYSGQSAPESPGSLDAAMATARAAIPGMHPSFVAYPGTAFSSPHHYAVFMKGDSPFTSRLLQPALVDAQTAELTDSRPLPWYVTALLVSQPLHFGDYGGLPLKIVWAVLDILAIVVLGSGLYLWLVKREATAPRGEPDPLQGDPAVVLARRS